MWYSHLFSLDVRQSSTPVLLHTAQPESIVHTRDMNGDEQEEEEEEEVCDGFEEEDSAISQ